MSTLTRVGSGAALFKALAAAQAEFPSISRTNEADTGKFKYRYADLGTIKQAVDPILRQHGLGITQFPDTCATGLPALTTILFHSSGESLSACTPLVGADRDAQAQGAAITYERRYGIVSVLGLVTEDDDDGAAAMPNQASSASQRPAGEPRRMSPPQAPQRPSSPVQGRTGGASERQVNAIAKMYGKASRDNPEIFGDQDVHEWVAGFVGHPIASLYDLTGGRGGEASGVFELLQAILNGESTGPLIHDNEEPF